EVDRGVAGHRALENLQGNRWEYRIDRPAVNEGDGEGICPWAGKENGCILFGDTLEHQGCPTLLEGLPDRATESERPVECGREDDGGFVPDSHIHADGAFDLLAYGPCLGFRVTGVEENQSDVVLDVLE